jgi:hypothetical protein
MSRLLVDEIRTARKDYRCDAWGFLSMLCSGDVNDMDVEERAIYDEIESNPFIKKGTKYLYQKSVDSGEFFEFRARLDCHDLCEKYDAYPYVDW